MITKCRWIAKRPCSGIEQILSVEGQSPRPLTHLTVNQKPKVRGRSREADLSNIK